MANSKTRKRARLAEAQNWRCAYCTGVMAIDGQGPDCASIEHVVPIRLGGRDEQDNLVCACMGCNFARSAFYSARAFLRIRRWLLRVGRWPACSHPAKHVRRHIQQIFREAEALRLRKDLALLEAAPPPEGSERRLASQGPCARVAR